MISSLNAVARQPLLHFLVLGALIFVVDRVAVGRVDDPRAILIDDAKYAEIAGIYRDNRGVAPTSEEMATLTVKWAQNEMLYREARLMGLDQGDEMIRQRLILKLRNVLFNRVTTATPDEEELQAYFERNRARYDQPGRFDVEQFRVASQEQAVAVAADLEGPVPAERASELRKYPRRPKAALGHVFQPEHVDAMLDAEVGAWVPVQSRSGWHVARVTQHHAPVAVALEDVLTRVKKDWTDDAMQAYLAETLSAVAEGYDIRIRLTTPPQEWDEEMIRNVQLAMRELE